MKKIVGIFLLSLFIFASASATYTQPQAQNRKEKVKLPTEYKALVVYINKLQEAQEIKIKNLVTSCNTVDNFLLANQPPDMIKQVGGLLMQDLNVAKAGFDNESYQFNKILLFLKNEKASSSINKENKQKIKKMMELYSEKSMTLMARANNLLQQANVRLQQKR